MAHLRLGTAGVTCNGELIGVPDQIEEVGLFCNKDLFDKLGLPAPTDLASLQGDAAKIKQAGTIPVAAGDKEAWEGGHFLSMALANAVGPKADADLVANKSSWDSAGVVDSLSIWSQFAKDGYLPPTPSAISYDNSNALFYSQKPAMDQEISGIQWIYPPPPWASSSEDSSWAAAITPPSAGSTQGNPDRRDPRGRRTHATAARAW